jgi:flagellar biogenesis protein FliO
LTPAAKRCDGKQERELEESERKNSIGGWAGWLLRRLNCQKRHEPRLCLLERIALAPRQTLALIEADGKRLLVATSPEGGPAFYPLDERAVGAVPGATRGRRQRSEIASSTRASSATRISSVRVLW